METWIKADDIWSLWAIIVGWAAVSIYLEQRYRWAAKVSGAIIALLGALVLANLGVIPTDSPVYDTIWGYVVLLAVPIMLFKANLRKIWLESGRTFLAFHIAAIGTVVGSILGLLFFGRWMPEALQVAAMITGSYIGGTVNFVAMSTQFQASQNVINASIVADNLNMALYFFVLLAIPSLLFFRRHYEHPYEKAANEGLREGENRAASYWGRKEIALLDIAKVVAAGFILVAVSVKLAGWMGAHPSLPAALRGILGSKYFVVTTLTVVAVTLCPRFFEEARGSQEIGTFLIYIFLVVIGTPASVRAIFLQSPIILLFCAFVVLVNMVVTLLVGKLFGFNLEELLVSSNATIGGPTTAAAMAISKGWDDLVLPAMLVGVWGYVIGNWIAITLGQAVFPALLG
ncbi:DUF819 family protein [Fretibacterium sp. OH1220_COT-178]|uniref:DUF819 family protein n=1 Tax=Fretibacterium sp. OH1220_COT-178 TaxID=2491047 RepID=UPI000F5F163E|nr:DUF819 family protein [Fretibacterium sp. OH1220_COT-178]RRD64463.1 DUF819 family protein [Fretibacterium sp. OH1220_COT-178]